MQRFYLVTGRKIVSYFFSFLLVMMFLVLAAPVSYAQTATQELKSLIETVPGASGYKYDLKDSQSVGMDGVKVIGNPAGGYLGVYHHPVNGVMQVRLASSTDLLNWTYKVTLENAASQATIEALSNGAFLAAYEKHTEGTSLCGGSGGCLALRYYPNLTALYAGSFSKEKVIPRTLSNCNEGTPNIYSVTLNPDIDHSTIQLGFHYHRNCDVDREAKGTLTNFVTFSGQADTTLNTVLEGVGTVGGNIGDRDSFLYKGERFNVHEVQFTKNDFGSWKSYLYSYQTNSATLLNIQTHQLSTAFANPTFTNIKLPNGKNGFVSTQFIPSEGAKPGEAGSLIYFKEYPSVNGLTGVYYDNKDLTGLTVTRIDPTINFEWGSGSPHPSIGPDTFSVRWTGEVMPQFSQAYKFYAQTDDGVRVWVNNQQIINQWVDKGATEISSSPINLTSGQKYPIKVEYYENGGGAKAILRWSSASQSKQVVPQSRLFTTP